MVLVGDDAMGPGGGKTGSTLTDILNGITGVTKGIGTALQGKSQQAQDNLLEQAMNSTGSGYGYGSGSSVDHFFDVNPLDQAAFDQGVKQQAWENDFNIAQFNWKKANDDRDYALAVGDLELAKQKQADANYWQGKSYELEQSRMALDERMNSANNATKTQIAQMEAASRAETARIAAQADKYAADLRLQEGLANATNDQERNRVLLAHEQEMAAIAKMEDDTKRLIASGEQKIGGFNAETARMAQMGDIALKNNQFLLDASKSPRDLFGLYFMQRGVTPDWDSLAAGNPTQGEGLKVYDPMKAYAPNITMPQDFTMNPGQSYGGVGNASDINLNANPYLQMGMQQTQQQQPPQGFPAFARGTDNYLGKMTSAARRPSATNVNPNVNALDFGVTSSMPQDDLAPPAFSPSPTPRGYRSTGYPSTHRGQRTRVDSYNPQPMMFSLPEMPQQPSQLNSGPSPLNMQPQQPGYTREPAFLTGDSPKGNPWSGGAKPELIENPTQAPIRVKNTLQTAADFGIIPNIATDKIEQVRFPQQGQGFNTQDYIRQLLEMYAPQMQNYKMMGNPSLQREMIARYPIGTDLSQQYANMGMSQLWQNSSNNDHLQGMGNIPTWLQTLADYGTPIAPSLANSVTGRTSPTLNLANAFNQRGGGILPSLQTLNRQSDGENQLFQGYLEGPVGMPAQDTLDFIGRPTQNLRTAQRSSAIMS